MTHPSCRNDGRRKKELGISRVVLRSDGMSKNADRELYHSRSFHAAFYRTIHPFGLNRMGEECFKAVERHTYSDGSETPF